ncbi:MAG: Crp/Fnr family transcriptional regulator [Chloroflexota bacterium]
MSDLLNCLKEAPVFSKLTASDHDELVNLATFKQFKKGDLVCWQDDLWPYAAYIEEGHAEWSMLSPEGKRQFVFRLGPCDAIWGHTIFDGQPMPASLEVMTPMKIYLWHKDIVLPIVSRHPEAIWDITEVLVTYMRHVREVVYGFAFHPVAGRLARLLLNHYQPIEGKPTPRDLTLDELADNIGTTRELVSRTLHRFANDGMIEISRVQFIFTNRDQLEKLAGKE